MVECKVLESVRKESSREQNLGFRRTDFSSFRNLVGWDLRGHQTVLKGKGAQEIWQTSRTTMLQVQEQSIPVLVKTSRHIRRLLLVSRELMVNLQCKNASYRGWKQGRDLKEEFRNIAQAGRGGVRETKPCLEVMLPTDIRNNRKGFYNCIGSKRLNKENVGTLMNGSNVLATVDTDKAESASLLNLTLGLLSVQ